MLQCRDRCLAIEEALHDLVSEDDDESEEVTFGLWGSDGVLARQIWIRARTKKPTHAG
jgi:hypothetical protein